MRFINKNFIIFKEFLQYDGNGNPIWRILDTINVRELKNNEILTSCDCQKDDKPDEEIIAIVIITDARFFIGKIAKAWRANTKTGRIEPIINLKGINWVSDFSF